MKYFSFLTPLFICCILCASTTNVSAQIVINEFSASNLSQYVDNHSDYNDWIELYNNSSSAINLGGYYLSDDTLNKTKWQIPSTAVIAANGFMRFWASGRNEFIVGNYHTNFSLKQTKSTHEYIVLSDAAASIIDFIDIHKKTQLGHSYGRKPDGATTWGVFISPSPNTSNTANVYPGYVAKPSFSVAPGFYAQAISVDITCADSLATIRYTLDGSQPTTVSPIYTGPITIASTKVIKAMAYNTASGKLPSFVAYESIFINVNHTLPVVSISASALTSLANNINANLTPFGSFEYFNDAQVLTAKSYGEFNRHGQDSWANSQRSLDFVSRDEMGYNHAVEEVLFNTTTRNDYQRVILRAAGDDNYPADHDPDNIGSAHIRDAFIHNVAVQDKLDLDARRGSKCVVYLNGQYWGVYDLRDNPDDHDNTKFYYGQDKYHLYYIETWGQTWAQYGGQPALNDWSALRTFILSNSMANSANFQYVSDRLDVKSLVDYVAVNMFTVCSDWLNWNTAWWRGLDSSGTHLKWGYTLWDNDATYGHYINYTNIPDTSSAADPCDPETLNGSSDPQDHIGILLALRQNPGFNQYYLTRMLDLWNTTFSCENLLAKLDSTENLIDPEMAQHSTRWSGTYTEWKSNVAQLRTFITNRCSDLTSGFMSCYNLTGPHTVTVDAQPAGAGTVQFNSVNLTNLPWTGTYFGNIGSNIIAKSLDTAYHFASWSANSQSINPNVQSDTANLILTNSDTIVAHFINPSSVKPLLASGVSFSVYPTLINSSTTITYQLAEAQAVQLSIYSSQGKLLTSMVNPTTKQNAGTYTVQLDFGSSKLTADVYLIKLNAGDYSKSIKVVYLP